MFRSARIKLTAWYLVTSMSVSLLFSAAIYSGVNEEFRRFERLRDTLEERLELGLPVEIPRGIPLARLDPDMITQARSRLLTSLGIINLAILVTAGGAGYFLAGRTLRPIRDMVEEQQRFISDASHELRTPLTSLRSEIEVNLRNKKFTVSDAHNVLASNLEEVVRLQTLSDHLLELTRYETVSLQQYTEEFSLKASIEDAIKKILPLAKKRKIGIDAVLNDATIRGIKENIRELWIILLDNAIKYSPTQSTIRITSKKHDGTASIMVQDEGIGIARDDLPHIFDRFFRADTARSKNTAAGYGLGLSIAKRIVSFHHGSIWVTSKIQKGTAFSVRLPCTHTSRISNLHLFR